MKSYKIIIVLFICILALIGCSKIDDLAIPEENSQTETLSLESFIQNHFEKKYELSISQNQIKTKASIEKVYSDYANEELAQEVTKELNDQRIFRERWEDGMRYIDSEVRTIIKKGSLKEKDGIISCLVYIYFILYENENNPETGKPNTSEGIDLVELVIEKQGQDFIISKEQSTDYYIESPELFEIIPEDEEDVEKEELSISTKSSGYSYSGKNAVKFALKYYNGVSKVKNYHDYTYEGGDCTNFLSRCLLEGGWLQNNSWFFTKDGSSGNDMKKYKRSPSWTKANSFYEYITATGSMYKNSKGDKRVSYIFENLQIPKEKDSKSTWTKFYTKIQSLKLGDIVQIGDGKIYHSMIVTTVSSKHPYTKVTYRNADNYKPRGDRPLTDIGAGTRLYGFNVKSSGK